MRLTALRPENPVAMMAAYGTLRLLPGAELRWANAHPEVRWDGDMIDTLAKLFPGRKEAPEITSLDDPRDRNIGGVEGYRRLAAQIPHDWLSAYAAETSDGISHTRLLLFSGGHKLVHAARELMDALAKFDIPDRLREALIGP